MLFLPGISNRDDLLLGEGQTNVLLIDVIPSLTEPANEEDRPEGQRTRSPEPNGCRHAQADGLAEPPYRSRSTEDLEDELGAEDLEGTNQFTREHHHLPARL